MSKLGEFHWRDGWYFRREDDGSVSILRDSDDGEGRLLVGSIPASDADSVLPFKWCDIAEAPRDGTWILTISKNAGGFWCVPQVARWVNGEWQSPVSDARVMLYHQPTHWMPLPISDDYMPESFCEHGNEVGVCCDSEFALPRDEHGETIADKFSRTVEMCLATAEQTEDVNVEEFVSELVGDVMDFRPTATTSISTEQPSPTPPVQQEDSDAA